MNWTTATRRLTSDVRFPGLSRLVSAMTLLVVTSCTGVEWPSEPSLSPPVTALLSTAGDPNDYTVSRIDFAPEESPLPSKALPECDDCLFGEFVDGSATGRGIQIGFDFTFYGQIYTELWVSSNGFITFSPGDNGCCEGGVIPQPDPVVPVNNIIAAAWTDLNPMSGQVRVETRGDAPHRRLIVDFVDVAFCCDLEQPEHVTTQIILYEGSNRIEIHTTSLSVPPGGHPYTQGIENAHGTSAAFVEGRVQSNLPLVRDAIRFTAGADNRQPVASVSAPATLDEGSTATLSVSASDPDGDPLHYSLTHDDGTSSDGLVASSPFVLTHVYAENGTYLVKLTVTDSRGGSATAEVPVTVVNVAPVVSVTPTEATIFVGEPFAGAGSFADPGPDVSTATADYGDGSGPQPLPLSGNAFQLSRTYAAAGTYRVVVTVTDDDGGVGTATVVVTVQTLSQATDQIAATISALETSGALSAEDAQTLIVRLDRAAERFARGDLSAAIDQLQVFQHRVERMVASGQLSAEMGGKLIAAAERVIQQAR